MLTVGDPFPAFTAPACVGTGKDDIKTLSNKDYAGHWVVYFFYPKDFTFVCPTELAEFHKQLKAFADRDTAVVGGSTDNEYSHLAWRRAHPDLEKLGYPLLAAQKLAPELGILEKTEGYCLRATFIVDPHGVIQWVDVNQGRVGRNVAEVLRVLDALQSDELCPCNWKKGDPYVKVG
ncbi:MAG: peroxiredoxin [Planctomycetota bacterium]|jgi:peroxiredoxin (alkyl hydroperoxide reductase subunit C)|nr:peroxiredoxin [Planctomycetota bacterium]